MTQSDYIMRPFFQHRLYLCQGIDILPDGDHFRFFQPNQSIHYHAFCDDFGPMNMSSVIRFVRQLDTELDQHSCTLLYRVIKSRRDLTNAIFLLGSFMILRLRLPLEEVAEGFAWVLPDMIEAYRDATFAPSDFDLSLMDCWRGLLKGVELGWVGLPCSEEEYRWGAIDVDEYENYDDPINGDLHEVVPGKLIAFKGPLDLEGGAAYRDDERGSRDFSPEFYADVLEDFGVAAVVRLNEAHYDRRRFEERGVKVHELEFEDCTAPPDHVVEAFMGVVDGAGGAVAVHCKAGLGRTGTLIAVYLMRRHGFAAREAMGWLRIMRPGSVIGEQQHYLCALEAAGDGRGGVVGGVVGGGVGGEGVRERPCELAAQVAAGMERRGAARGQARWAKGAGGAESNRM